MNCPLSKRCSFYLDLLDNAGMGDGYINLELYGFRIANKNQDQYNHALHILDTHCSEFEAIDNEWANNLVRILTNGKIIGLNLNPNNISRAVSYFHGTEFKIWAGFGTAGQFRDKFFFCTKSQNFSTFQSEVWE